MSKGEKRPKVALINRIKSEYLVAFFAMVLIIFGAVAGEQLYPSRDTQTTESAAANPSEAVDFIRNDTPVESCSHFAIDEYSGVDSKLVRINPEMTEITLVKSYPCTTGICDFESLEADSVGDLLSVANTDKALYRISRFDGNFTKVATLTPGFNVTGLSFNNEGVLWAWVPGQGLYTIDTATGQMNLEKSSNLATVEDIAWDNNGRYLYLSKSPGNELHRFDPENGIIAFVGTLPGKTDAFNFAPSHFRNGAMFGAYRSSSNGLVYLYSYDIESQSVTDRQTISTNYSNLDALTLCTP